ncbi:MAG: hypothetical protein M1406_08010 [Nitrospirae bacterium]|nr:hypothetical protein [Nitrospirota bacterium]
MKTVEIDSSVEDEDVAAKEEKMIRTLVLLFGLSEEKAREWFKDLDESLRKKKRKFRRLAA